MYNKKNLGTLTFFTALSLGVVTVALTTQRANEKEFGYGGKQPDEISSFKEVSFFKIQENSPVIQLQAKELTITNQEILRFNAPVGAFVKNGREYTYKANLGEYKQTPKKMHLEGDVELDDSNSTYKSEKLLFDGIASTLNASGGVESVYLDTKTQDRIFLKSNELDSDLDKKIIKLIGSVDGKIKRKRRYEGGLEFKADEVEVNSLESRVSMNKNVKLKRNNYYLQAQKAEVFLENFNKKLKYYELYDDVKLEEQVRLRSGKKQTRRAYAEKLEAHQSAGKVILTGAPRVEQGDDIIRGYQITLRENVELVEVDDSQSSFSLKRNEDE
jgi:lipopolysaccharide transport protein LptA